jgi:intracellular septation protein
MTDNAPKTSKPKSPFWVDFGPILIFVVLFQVMRRGDNPDMAIYWATGASMAAIFAALIYSKFITKHISGQLWLTAALLLGMGALTIGFKNDAFIKLKPTILNVGFAGAIFAGLAMGKNPIKMLMGAAFEMPTDKWKILALRWAFYFLAMAALNIVIWKGFSENFWVNFKLLGFVPLSIAFIFSQMPFIIKHSDITTNFKDKD